MYLNNPALEIWPIMHKTTVVAKRELLYAWPFGVCAWLCGLIFIDRYAADKAKKTMNKAMESLKKKDIKLWIFPEGTRRNTGKLHEFKKGAFHVAIVSFSQNPLHDYCVVLIHFSLIECPSSDPSGCL